MHYSFIIIANKDRNSYIENELSNKIKDYLIINNEISMIDDCHLTNNECEFSFDYLIIIDYSLINNLKSIGIITEHHIPITNFEFQTLIENIYYVTIDKFNECIINIINPE